MKSVKLSRHVSVDTQWLWAKTQVSHYLSVNVAVPSHSTVSWWTATLYCTQPSCFVYHTQLYSAKVHVQSTIHCILVECMSGKLVYLTQLSSDRINVVETAILMPTAMVSLDIPHQPNADGYSELLWSYDRTLQPCCQWWRIGYARVVTVIMQTLFKLTWHIDPPLPPSTQSNHWSVYMQPVPHLKLWLHNSLILGTY